MTQKMAIVYVMHNVVKDFDNRSLLHRNCIDYEAFDKWLRERSDQFKSLSSALRDNRGECLTIDDATVGGYEAAMLCASCHHYVTIFINPYYIVNNKSYWTHYLTLFVDQIRDKYFLYKDEWFDVSREGRRKKLRKSIKTDLCQISDESARVESLEKIFNKKVTDAVLPYQLRTMSGQQLDELAENEYVSIEYHGWTHGDITSMTVEQVAQELEMGKSWFMQRLNKEIRYFALPFGTRQKQIEEIKNIPFIFMGDSDYPDDYGTDKLHNRIPLVID